MRWAPPAASDWVAGLSMAGLLLPEAVAYAGIAGLPPQSGVVALFAGLLVYGLMGGSRFAIVSATSSSATVLLAACLPLAGNDLLVRAMFASGIVLVAGLLFGIAAAARLGMLSNFIAKPVLRGFALGLALTIVVRQLPHVLDVSSPRNDLPRFTWQLLVQWQHWNWAGLGVAVAALLMLIVLARWRRIPAALVVLACGIALDLTGWCAQWHVAAVGDMHLAWPLPQWPALSRSQWLQLPALAFALALILYAESYGSIRTLALRHGDSTQPNRDLLALGAANLTSGLLQGLPVGAGYSASSANEGAGAQTKAAGLIACAVVALAIALLLGWLAHIPQPVLAAIVIHAVGHTLNPRSLQPYFVWHRDRLLVLLAFAAVLMLGVLDGLLVAVAGSLLLWVRSFSRPRISWLGQMPHSRDYVDALRHPEALVPGGLLIARPEAPLFFGNADTVCTAVQERVLAQPQARGLVLSLEESGDLDGSSVESLCDLAQFLQRQGIVLVLARVKDHVRDLLDRVQSPQLSASCYSAWSVDDAVQQLQAQLAQLAGSSAPATPSSSPPAPAPGVG